MTLIPYLLATPALTALLILFVGRRRPMELVHVMGSALTMLVGLGVSFMVFKGSPLTWAGYFYVDALGALMVLLIIVVSFLAGVYSIRYMGHDYPEINIGERKLAYYYTSFHGFVLAMLVAVTSDNLGLMWIAIEATTLTSAYLVGFYGDKPSLEAAWKYLILCSVGILFALMGTIILYFSSVSLLGESSTALNWTTLITVADRLDPELVKLAFLFVIIGYGTKAGLAPMHTWLPDAHSQAPTPISALLSGVLLKVALYGLIRFHIITGHAVGYGFSQFLILAFGLLSVVLAAFFILVQTDIKRLLAYSSLEHIGIISVGLGIGGFLGIYGALLHTVNHAITKPLAFFLAGDISQRYGTKDISRIRGVWNRMSVTGPMFFLAILALSGAPPFGIFISEFLILTGGFTGGHILVSGSLIIAIIMVFASLLNHSGQMAFGRITHDQNTGDFQALTLLPMGILLLAALVLGVYIPGMIDDILRQIIDIFGVI